MSGPSIRNVLRTTATGHHGLVADAAAVWTNAQALRHRPCPALPTCAVVAASTGSAGPRRWLSSTAPRAAHAIDFSPSSTPELEAVLETIRTKILLPSYLRAEQRRQLFSPRYEHKLRADPITLEIDGDVLRFTHMDLFRDVPNARAAARDAVGRMSTRADFENLPRLLEGLHRAGRRLRPADYARIARRAGERGCIFAVIESARTVRRTGFRLETSETVAEILTHVQLKAVDSSWDEEATRQALVWAELVVDLLEDEHHGRRPRSAAPDEGSASASASTSTSTPAPTASTAPPPPAFPLARDPQVLAARLHLAAVVAAKFGGGDADGKVTQYARELVQLWPAERGLRGLHPAAAYTSRHGEMHYLSEDNKFLGVAAPLLHGLDTARDVLQASEQAELAAELQTRRDVLGAEVAAALAAAPDRRGAAIYRKLFGEE